MTRHQVKRLQANYAGEVTMVDKWFGRFMDTLKSTGKLKNTVVAVISDHGHSLDRAGDKGLISKQGYPMTKAVANLVYMIRHPEGEYKGKTNNSLVYNFDLTPTLLRLVNPD